MGMHHNRGKGILRPPPSLVEEFRTQHDDSFSFVTMFLVQSTLVLVFLFLPLYQTVGQSTSMVFCCRSEKVDEE